jgi:ribosomal protein S18 acetylase RimI-like enzyme
LGVQNASPKPIRLWSGQVTVTARAWPGRPSCAYLLIAGGHSDDIHLPGPAVVDQWMHQLRTAGYGSVRTGAVGPDIAHQLVAQGFSVVQDLSLLSADVSGLPGGTPDNTSVRVVRRTPGRHGALVKVLDVDLEAFGPEWALDPETLAEASRATQASRLWVSTDARGNTVGFVLAGRTGSTGFVQRVAVHPSTRRGGVATGLLAHVHRWFRSRGCTTAVVNTEVSNTAALGLYQRFGYVRMPYGLQVLERTLTGEPTP